MFKRIKNAGSISVNPMFFVGFEVGSTAREKSLESPPDALQRQMPLFALPEARPKKPKTRSQPSRGHQRPVWKQVALIPQKGEKTLEMGSREATGQKAKRRLLGAGVAFGDFISAASPRPRQGSAKRLECKALWRIFLFDLPFQGYLEKSLVGKGCNSKCFPLWNLFCRR